MRIVAIGAWGHLGRVLGEIDQVPELSLCGMAPALPDEQPQNYRQAHRSAGKAELYDDWRRMLAQAKPHVAIISTRIDQISRIALEAAEGGCHLICEKPLAIDQATLGRLWNTCSIKRVNCIGILNNHAQPALIAAREAIQAGRLGTVVLLNARKSYKWGTRPDWFGRRALYGGTIPWIGIHALDFIYTLTGQSFTHVAAMQSNAAHPQHAECEDHAALLLRLSGGAHATASLDLLRPAAADTHGDDWIRVVGSQGVLEANLSHHTCSLTTDSEPAHLLPLPPALGVFVPFLRAVAGGTQPATVHAEMKRAFLLTHASLCARDAADRGEVIRVDPLYEGVRS